MLDDCPSLSEGIFGSKSPTPELDFGFLFLRKEAQRLGPVSPPQERGRAAQEGD